MAREQGSSDRAEPEDKGLTNKISSFQTSRQPLEENEIAPGLILVDGVPTVKEGYHFDKYGFARRDPQKPSNSNLPDNLPREILEAMRDYGSTMAGENHYCTRFRCRKTTRHVIVRMESRKYLFCTHNNCGKKLEKRE